jgi:enamine deaminase RidA (YjgF/YER057c/UK114 family)
VSPVIHLNPEGLPRNPAFSQAVRVERSADTIYVGGQNGVTADGTVPQGMHAQAEQALKNLQTVLAAGGASLEHVVKWTVLAVQGAPLQEALGAFQEAWGRRPNPPAISVAIVAALANPQFLFEIEAIAVVPGERP